MPLDALPSSVDTLVVGAGQAGLSMSRLLADAGREHVVLDRRRVIGGGWHDRWDSFCLVTPNAACRLPGYAYEGAEPGAFMPRDDVIAMLSRYAGSFDAPVLLDANVERLEQREDGRFEVTTSRGTIVASRVVVAAGGFHRPNIPAIATGLSPRVLQIHSQDYRNEASLPPGGVLVVGSGQSGGQIAEELHEAGRKVWLSMGTAGMFPRRYRGRDLFAWFAQLAQAGERLGVALPTVDTLPSPRARLTGNAMMSGKRGGHDIDLRAMATEGVRLAGHVTAMDGERVAFAPDLHASLRLVDSLFDQRVRPLFDRLIDLTGVDAPPDDRPRLEPFMPPEPADVDLAAEGVSTVIWTSGYRLAFDWIRLPIFDDMGYPRHHRGVSEVPGLSFLGLPWMWTQASPTFVGVAMDAQFVFESMDREGVAA